ncbi:hypothetical protein [Vibrio sp. D431a]|uniref:hypothetical protein n=1 Tax=Vibrio sp. D431a TaxID=2837388 RepID=UPI0025553CF5|nr:hypothetical protein [Vibrio sp. D431a]MDK9793762.1 hypothetical protein [Vibrio sp. D431a]
MSNKASAGFSLRNAASYIFRQFSEDFKVINSRYKDDPEGYLGEIKVYSKDGNEELMNVSARIKFVPSKTKGKESFYKCVFTVKCDNYKIKRELFVTRTLTIEDNTLESKIRVVNQLNTYREELLNHLANSIEHRAKTKVVSEKNLELLRPELEEIKSSLGDVVKDFETNMTAGEPSIGVRINLNNNESIYTTFDGVNFSLTLLSRERSLTTQKLIAIIDAISL